MTKLVNRISSSEDFEGNVKFTHAPTIGYHLRISKKDEKCTQSLGIY